MGGYIGFELGAGIGNDWAYYGELWGLGTVDHLLLITGVGKHLSTRCTVLLYGARQVFRVKYFGTSGSEQVRSRT